MPYKEGQADLLDYLGSTPVRREVQKPLFGKPYLRFDAYCHILSFVYEEGALLGRAKRHKLSILEKMLIIPGIKLKPVEDAQEMAKARLDGFRKESGGEPSTFSEFIELRAVEGALKRYGLNLPPRNEGEAWKIRKVGGVKMPLREAIPGIKLHVLEGIGFGSSFPELTEEMFRRAYKVDTYYDTFVRDERSERPMLISTLEKREKAVLLMVAAYTSECYPELVDPLDLRKDVEEAKKKYEEIEKES